jgi:hypothetical protein
MDLVYKIPRIKQVGLPRTWSTSAYIDACNGPVLAYDYGAPGSRLNILSVTYLKPSISVILSI